MVPLLLQPRACPRPVRHLPLRGQHPLGVRHWYIVVDSDPGTCTATTSVDRPADATIGVDLGDLVALAVGELKGTDAFVNGRLKISGDVFFAMNWIEWFGSRSTPPKDD